MTEVELCNIVKASNLFPGFKLHEEVGMDINGNSCDMIYENGTDVFCIEAKLHFNFEVLEQASRWRNVASMSFIAVPWDCLKNWFYSPKRTVAYSLGLGVIGVSDDTANFADKLCNPFIGEDFYFGEKIYKFPADLDFWKNIFSRIGENRTPAGSKIGKRSTPFSRSMDALMIEAKNHPDYNLKQLLNIVPTHYCSVKSAESAIRGLVSRGIIEKFWR